MIMESMIVEQLPSEYRGVATDGTYSLADEYADAQEEMLRLHIGEALDEAAEHILAALPPGPLSLLASSMEGVALVAVCAARRADDTDWQRISHAGDPVATAHPPIVVEPVNGGEGWQQAVRRRHPAARFLILERFAGELIQLA
jgi:hypothetical protein